VLEIELTKWWLPGIWRLVTLGLVDVVCDGNELRVGQVIGELLASGRSPGVGTRLPGVGERNDVVDIDIGGGGPGGTVKWRVPGSGGGIAARVGNTIVSLSAWMHITQK
jgi:hypothetical protein